MSTLSERIERILRENPEIDKSGLGRIAGVTKGTVSQWLDGKIKSIKMSYAVRIEKHLGYRPAWLVMGEGAPKDEGKHSLSKEAAFLIECIERLDGLGDRARKSFALHAGLFLLSFPDQRVEDSKAEHDLLDLAEREAKELVPRHRQGPVEEKNAGSK